MTTYTPTTIKQMSPLQISQITTADIAALSSADLVALSTAQVQALGSSQIGALTTSQIPVFTPTQTLALTSTQLASLSTTQIQALATNQIPYFNINSVIGFTANQMTAFTTQQITALENAPIYWDLNCLTPTAIGGLSAAQIALIPWNTLAGYPTSSIQNIAVGAIPGLTAFQLNGLLNGNGYNSLTNAQIAALTVTQIGMLPTWGIPYILPSQFTALSTAQIQALNTAEINVMTSAQLGALTASQFRTILNAQISALTTTQVQQLSAGTIGALSSGQAGALSSAQVGALTTAQFATLVNAGELPYLAAGAIQGITTAQFGVLVANQGLPQMIGAQIGAMTSSQFQGLSASQIHGLTSSQISGLSPTQITTITPAELSAWNVGQLQSISANAISGMTSAQIDALSYLSVEYAAGEYETLDPDHEGTMFWFLSYGSMSFNMYQNYEATNGSTVIQQLDYRNWLTAMTSPTARASFANLTPDQVAALTTAQIRSLNPSELNFLTSAQLGALTPVQVQALTLNQLFSTTMGQTENGLWIPQFQSLSSDAIAALSTSQFSALLNNAPYLSNLTANQASGLTTSQMQALIASGKVGSLTPAVISGLSPTNVLAIPSAQICAFSTAQLASICPAAMSGLNATEFARFFNGSADYLTGAQIGALSTSEFQTFLQKWPSGSLNSNQISGLTPIELQSISTSQLTTLPSSQVNGLTAGQMAALSSAQISAIGSGSWTLKNLQPAALAGISPGEINNVHTTSGTTGLNSLSVTQERLLTPNAIAAITTTQFANLTPAFFGNLSTSQVYALGLNQLRAMSSAQMGALATTVPVVTGSSSEILVGVPGQPQTVNVSYGFNAALTAGNLNTIITNDMAQLASALDFAVFDFSTWPAAFIDGLTTSEISMLPAVSISTLTPVQLYNWTASQWSALSGTGKQIYLSAASLAALNPSIVSSLPSDFFAKLPDDGWTNLSLPLVSQLTTAQVAALTPDQVWAMEPAQLAALGANVRYLSSATNTPAGQAANLSTLAIEGLSGLQVSAVQSIPNVVLSGTPIGSMTTSQLASLSVNDINNLPIAAFTQLSTQQLAALPLATCLNLDLALYSSLSSAQQAALHSAPANLSTPGNMSSLSASAIAALSPMIIAGLSAEQFAALSPVQVQALTQTQIAAIPGPLLESFTNATWAMFTSTQTGWFNVAAEQSVTTTQVQTLTLHPGNWTTSQISVLANDAQTASQLPTPPFSASRNVYFAGLYSQIYSAVPYINLQSHPSNSVQVSDAERQAWNNVEAANGDYERVAKVSATAKNTMLASKQVRLAGSLFAAFAIAAEFQQAGSNPDPSKIKGVSMGQANLQAAAWLVSALQVPVNLFFNKVFAYWTSRTLAQSQDANTQLAESIGITDQNEIGQIFSAEENIENSNISAAENNIESILALPPDSTQDRATAVVAADSGVTASALEASSVPSRSSSSKTSLLVDLALKPMLKDGIFIISDVFGMLTTLPLGSGDDRKEDIALASIMSVFTIGDLIGMGTSWIQKLYGAKLSSGLDASEAAVVDQKITQLGNTLDALGIGILGAGTDLLQVVFGTFGFIGAQSAYDSDNAMGNVTALQGDKVALDGAIANLAVGTSSVATAMVIQGSSMAAAFFGVDGAIAATGVGLPVAVALAAIQVLLPNWNAAGEAISYANLESQLDGEGRTVEGDIVDGTLHSLASLNAVPVVNWLTFAYTPSLMATIYDEMMGGGMSLALSQDYAWNLTTSVPGQVYVAQLEAQIQMSQATQLASGAASTLSDVLVITAQTADSKAYMASSTSSTLYYLESLDVTATGYTTMTTPTGQLPSTNVAQTITLSDQGTGWKMVVLNSVLTSNSWSATQPIIVDATSASESMQFIVNTQYATVYGGSGPNIYSVDMSVPAGYTIVGGSSGNDVVQFTSSAILQSGTINLDGISNAQVKAAANVMSNTVTGTNAGQLYTYAGGIDKVTMTGGSGQVLVGGLGTHVTMAGGNNTVGVALGLDPLSLIPSNFVPSTTVSSYNGGTPVAASTDSLGNSFSGENTINFAAATNGLVMNIVDPSGATPSTVALNVPGGTFADNATFQNFQNVVGSNDGDNITITNCTTLNRILLGSGNNDVVLNRQASSNNSLGVVGLTAGPGNNNFWLTNGSNALIGTSDGTSNIMVESGSTLHAELGATSDIVDASNDVVSGGTTPLIDVQTEGGMHTLTLNNEQANITLDGGGTNNPKANGNWTIINDAPGRTSADTLIITLGSDMSSELVTLNSNGSLSFYSNDGSNQRLDYSCSAMAADGDAFIAGTSSLQQSFISINQLVQAMSLDSDSQTQTSFNGQTVSGISLASLYQVALTTAAANQVTHA